MSDLVRLHWYHAEDPGRDGHMIVPQSRARRLMRWSSAQADADEWTFYVEPFFMETPLVAKFIAIIASIKADYLAAESVMEFARLYWLELLAIAIAISSAVGITFAPKWDRPIVGLSTLGVAIAAFALGRRYPTKS